MASRGKPSEIAVRAAVFIAASLDGFIARPDGKLDWLPGADGGPMPEDNGYADFMKTVDVVVMGRGTFETVLGFGGWPFGKTPVVVLTSRPLDLPDRARGKVTLMSGEPAEVLARLADRGFGHAYVDGGRTIQGFLAAGLVRRLVVTTVPVLLGRGIPLFGPLPGDVRLRHVRTRTLSGGLVQSEYEVP